MATEQNVYLVYHFLILMDESGRAFDDFYEPSGIVIFVAGTLTDAITYMEAAEASDEEWWMVQSFTVDKVYDGEEDPGVYVGWYDHKVRKLKESPFHSVLEKMLQRRGFENDDEMSD